MEPVSKIDKRGDLNKRGGRKIFLKSINGEALIRVSRVEKISDNNKRASPFIRKVRVVEYICMYCDTQCLNISACCQPVTSQMYICIACRAA